VINMSMSTFEAMLSAVTIGDSVLDEDRVITKTMRGMFVLSGSSGSFILLKLEPIFYYEQSLYVLQNLCRY
jgi:hypothetical protein